MYHIKTFNKIAPAGLARFNYQHFDLEDQTQPHAILLRSYPLTEQEIEKSIEVIARAGAGTNNIPVSEMSARGTPVLNTPGANANAVKEIVIAAMLMSKRHLADAWKWAQSAQRKKISADEMKELVENAKKEFVGRELVNETLGVIGLGSIGVQVANAAIKMGMRVIGYDPMITVEHSWQLSSQVECAEQLPRLLRQADCVSLHVPLNKKTKQLINGEVLSNMKPDSLLLNFSRAEVVDEDAIETMLKQNLLGGYTCDFPDLRWKKFDNVLTFPHLGASTIEAESNCAVMAAEETIDYLLHGSIQHSVNFPTVHLGPTRTARITLAHDNIPNMVSQISQIIADAKINIEQLTNKSRAELAYTVVDIDKTADESLIEKFKKYTACVIADTWRQ